MEINLIITLAIISVGIFLFVKNYFSVDTTSILIMALFIVTGVLAPEEGFAGFNHPATLTLGCMFVISTAVFKTGILNSLSQTIVRYARIHYFIALFIFITLASLLSAFVNDSAVVALLIPIALKVAREAKISPGRLLMPISFAALFGGTCTVIGTSTNILVNGYAEKYGLTPFNMFEFTEPALLLLAIGAVYLLIVGPLALPARKDSTPGSWEREAEKYIVEIEITRGSPDIGLELYRTKLVKGFDANILSLNKSGVKITEFTSRRILEEGDKIKAVITTDKLNDLRKTNGYRLSDSHEDDENEQEPRKLFEAIIPIGSVLAGKTLQENSFRHTYAASVIAIRSHRDTWWDHLSSHILKEGDMMLLLTTEGKMNNLNDQKLLITLSEHAPEKINYRKAIIAILIAVGVVTAAALNLVSILISAMVGSLLLILTNVLKPKEAYKAIEWKVIFMMAGVISMGAAVEKSGGAEIASAFIEHNLGAYDPRITLSLIFLFTFLSTNILSSKASAAIMTPIVINLAAVMQVSEKPFLIAVMFACSLTFMTPVSYPTNTMVYAPGNYRFSDFIKIGTPLNIIIWLAASFIIPYYFPF